MQSTSDTHNATVARKPSKKKSLVTKTDTLSTANKTIIASAGNRTPINCLEGNYANHYTTDACGVRGSGNAINFILPSHKLICILPCFLGFSLSSMWTKDWQWALWNSISFQLTIKFTAKQQVSMLPKERYKANTIFSLSCTEIWWRVYEYYQS